MDVDEFDIQMYALFLRYCIGTYRQYFVSAADADALYEKTAAVSAQRHTHPIRIDYRLIKKDLSFEMPQGRQRTLGKHIYVGKDVQYLGTLNALENIDLSSLADVEALFPVHLDQLSQSTNARRALTDDEKATDAFVALYYYAARAELAHLRARQEHESIGSVQERFAEVKAIAEGGRAPMLTVQPSGKSLLSYDGKRRQYGAANKQLAEREFATLKELFDEAEKETSRVTDSDDVWARFQEKLRMSAEEMAAAWRQGAWNANLLNKAVAKRILAQGSITPGALEPSYRCGRLLCRIQSPDRPLKDAHGRGELLTDEQMLTPFLCVEHAHYLRVFAPGRNYHASEVAYNMERVWPEHTLFKGDLPAFIDAAISRAEVTQDRLVRGTGVELHAPFRTIESGNTLVKMLRGEPAYAPALGLDISAALFSYVRSTRAPFFKSLLLAKEYIRYTEASSVYTSGMSSLDLKLSFIAMDKEHIGMHVLPNLQLTDRWIQSATIGSWMSSAIMDIVNQALVVANAPGLSEEERFVIVAALDRSRGTDQQQRGLPTYEDLQQGQLSYVGRP